MVVKFSPREADMPIPTKEDYLIRLMEDVRDHFIAQEGGTQILYPFEGDLAAPAAGVISEFRVEADFPHDAWVVYFRFDAAVTLRVWPGASIPASGAIEIRNGNACRIKSTSPYLMLRNTGTNSAHYFAIAVSQAEVEFMSLV